MDAWIAARTGRVPEVWKGGRTDGRASEVFCKAPQRSRLQLPGWLARWISMPAVPAVPALCRTALGRSHYRYPLTQCAGLQVQVQHAGLAPTPPSSQFRWVTTRPGRLPPHPRSRSSTNNAINRCHPLVSSSRLPLCWSLPRRLQRNPRIQSKLASSRPLPQWSDHEHGRSPRSRNTLVGELQALRLTFTTINHAFTLILVC